MSRNTDKKRGYDYHVDDILFLTNNGLDIWKREIPNLTLTDNIISPLRPGEKNASFRVKQSRITGIYVGYDHTTEELLTPFTLIQKLYNLDLRQALNKIASDLNLKPADIEYKRSIAPTQQSNVLREESIIYEYEEMKFQKRHHAYWNPGELTEDFLRQNDVYAAKKIAANKKAIVIPDDQMCFVYVPKDLEYGKLKILRVGPGVDKAMKWRNSIPGNYLWDFHQYEKSHVDKLFVVKSRKDQLVMKLLGLETISTQSEQAGILHGNMEDILNVTDLAVLVFGSDPQGVKACKEVQQAYNRCRYYNTPKSLLPDINDPFGYVSNFSLRKLERHLQSKKLI